MDIREGRVGEVKIASKALNDGAEHLLNFIGSRTGSGASRDE